MAEHFVLITYYNNAAESGFLDTQCQMTAMKLT